MPQQGRTQRLLNMERGMVEPLRSAITALESPTLPMTSISPSSTATTAVEPVGCKVQCEIDDDDDDEEEVVEQVEEAVEQDIVVVVVVDAWVAEVMELRFSTHEPPPVTSGAPVARQLSLASLVSFESSSPLNHRFSPLLLALQFRVLLLLCVLQLPLLLLLALHVPAVDVWVRSCFILLMLYTKSTSPAEKG
ncbi:hypothetical protein E2C01_000028 [Portunus trituberculatus]|uniref:Uncharacterized protein n=1 Tax=Portunus trituberculatus TaxID=210409 RepID=A0A5B7CG76_PORTR|nr:hypothetical protein [Portunus trituberculatus]